MKNILNVKYDFIDSRDKINWFINQYLEKSQNSEIELRLGNIFYNNSNYLNTLKDVSKQGIIMLNDLNNNEKYRFDPNLDEYFFNSKFNIINNNKEHLKEKNEIIIDFIISSLNLRYQYMPLANQFIQSVKNDKRNLDIISKGIEMRLSCAVEENKKLTKDDFLNKLKTQKVEFIRFKIRRKFDFQYMELSFTKTYSSNYARIKNINWINSFIDNIDNGFNGIYNLFTRNLLPEFNIELEIIDNNFLNQTRKKNYYDFDKIIKKFFRTLEVICISNKSFCYKNYIEKFGKNNIPEIGNYINEFLN